MEITFNKKEKDITEVASSESGINLKHIWVYPTVFETITILNHLSNHLYFPCKNSLFFMIIKEYRICGISRDFDYFKDGALFQTIPVAPNSKYLKGIKAGPYFWGTSTEGIATDLNFKDFPYKCMYKKLNKKELKRKPIKVVGNEITILRNLLKPGEYTLETGTEKGFVFTIVQKTK